MGLARNKIHKVEKIFCDFLPIVQNRISKNFEHSFAF